MKTSINFGLVYIPVVLSISAKVEEISFNQLDKKTNSRVRYIKTCEDCNGKKVEQSDIVKAYQYKKDNYVVFSEEDFDKLKTDADKTIRIDSFVNLDEIDPVYYDKHYYVESDGNDKGYSLLLHLLESENKVAVAKSMIGSKEKIIALRVKDGNMLLSTLFFEHEIQGNKAKEVKNKPSSQELELGKQLLQSMSAAFEPEKFKDEYAERVKAAIELKIEGKELEEPAAAQGGKIIDLMEALTQSIKNDNKTDKPRAKKAVTKPKTDATAHRKSTVRPRGVAVRAKARRA
ncbi:MAG: Ku protein [Firmicutes bacterium]|nr:Ku protein [Bacillota bacterium]